MINNQNFIYFIIHKSATSVATPVDLNKSNRVATGNRLSRLSRDWSVVYASLKNSQNFYVKNIDLLLDIDTFELSNFGDLITTPYFHLISGRP